MMNNANMVIWCNVYTFLSSFMPFYFFFEILTLFLFYRNSHAVRNLYDSDPDDPRPSTSGEGPRRLRNAPVSLLPL